MIILQVAAIDYSQKLSRSFASGTNDSNDVIKKGNTSGTKKRYVCDILVKSLIQLFKEDSFASKYSIFVTHTSSSFGKYAL